LGLDAGTVIPKEMQGWWSDTTGIDEDKPYDRAPTARFAQIRKKSGWSGLFFGGVAFKYQPEVKNVATVARIAARFVDVVTTSGDETGKAPHLSKIQKMKEALGDHPLAIASGITPENVLGFCSYADCFLVATGISDSHTKLNRSRVKEFAHAMKEANAAM